MRPLPPFRSCSIDITAYRQAVIEQLDTLTGAEAEGDRGVGINRISGCARRLRHYIAQTIP
jgi:hypothetical protein